MSWVRYHPCLCCARGAWIVVEELRATRWSGNLQAESVADCAEKCAESDCVSFEWNVSGSDSTPCQLSSSCDTDVMTSAGNYDLYINVNHQVGCSPHAHVSRTAPIHRTVLGNAGHSDGWWLLHRL